MLALIVECAQAACPPVFETDVTTNGKDYFIGPGQRDLPIFMCTTDGLGYGPWPESCDGIILISSVQDANSVASVVPFMPQQDCGTELTWPEVTTNADGSAADDIRGYIVYQYPPGERIAITMETFYHVRNLVSGTYVFAVTAFDEAGNESTHSPHAEKVIP